jgi:hypothetical protein
MTGPIPTPTPEPLTVTELNPLHHVSAAEPLSVADLRDTIARVLVHAIPPDSAPLSDTKDVVIGVGGKVYPLSGIGIAFYGGRVVLQLDATDVPPCHYCGRVGNHFRDAPCRAWEYTRRVAVLNGTDDA